MIERAFEWFLWNSRFMVLVAVICSLLGSFMLFAFAGISIFALAIQSVDHYLFGVAMPDLHVEAVGQIITAIDEFLLATVLLIFALGLYELFISKLELAHAEEESQNILIINSLDDLKDRLGKVIIMILIVLFFKNVLHISFDNPLNILYLGGGILLVALSLYFTHKTKH
ncbi:MAG: YqhA family protein [Mariprofundales bacterium]